MKKAQVFHAGGIFKKPPGMGEIITVQAAGGGGGNIRHGESEFSRTFVAAVSEHLYGKKADTLIMDEYGAKSMTQKFAPVAPFHIYQQFLVNRVVPEQVLLLAHDVVANEKDYQETFEHLEWNNTTIFLDNSLVELKEAVDIEMVQKAAEIIVPDVIVLPDVMGDGPGTVKAVLDAWPEWSWTFKEYELMAVLQGQTMKDLVATCEALKHLPLAWVSIPRISEKGDFERLKMISIVRQYFPMLPIHLLGFSDFPWCDMVAASHPAVKSIDSAVPLRVEGEWDLSTDPGPRDPNWFANAEFNQSMLDNFEKVNNLISNQTSVR